MTSFASMIAFAEAFVELDTNPTAVVTAEAPTFMMLSVQSGVFHQLSE